MPRSRQPTMKDIARVVRLHASTVSLALRNDARLPLATREKVHAAARKLGYRPNPLVSALMSFRARRQAPSYQMELAFLCATSSSDAWLSISEGYRRMWTGARDRATQLGYLLNLYARGCLSAKRFTGILQARGISGIMVAPMPVASTKIDLDWAPFSIVELGFTLEHSRFHRVVHDYFHAMLLAMENVRRLGYRRPGLVLRSHTDDKAHHLWRAAFVDEQAQRPLSDRINPLIIPEIDPPLLSSWVRQERIDAILTVEPALVRSALKAGGIGVPRRIGLASLGCYTADDPHAGIYQSYEDMGAAAVDQLVAMVHRADRGFPARSLSTLIGGVWIDGPTLPAKDLC